MEKHVKKIADELRLIRKEMQKMNKRETVEFIKTQEAEPILSDNELVEKLSKGIREGISGV